jgi:hypothetical protein
MTAPAPAVALRTTRILWVAILISTFLFIGMGEFVRHTQPPTGEPPAVLLPILLVMAAGALVASFVLPARTLRSALLRRELPVVEAIDPSAMPGAYRENAPKRRVFANASKAERVAWLPYQTAFILQIALREVVALAGFPLLFFGASPVVWLPFFAVAWLALGLAWPSRAKAVRSLEQAYGAVLEQATSNEGKR